MIRSFDVFDTLLARAVLVPTDIFDIVELKYPFVGFKRTRVEAELRAGKTFDSIYDQFKLISGASDDTILALKEFEIMTEINNLIPIQSNISQVQDGDILVSDMYLTEETIMSLLRHHGFSKKVKLYVSPGGKSDGSMWTMLTKQYTIHSHLGDNMHSDIQMAERSGINGIYTGIHKFTILERHLLGTDVSRILRTFRLSNAFRVDSLEHKLFDQQVQCNIPLLLHMCAKLNEILTTENKNTVLFVSRDGCLIRKLFSFLFPQYKSIYFHSSRIMNRNPTQQYIDYVKRTYDPDSCIIFDLQGSFGSGRSLFLKLFNCLPRVYVFDCNNIANRYDGLTFTSLCNGDKIEHLNPDKVGTLVSFDESGDVRSPCEYDTRITTIIHDVMNNFIDFIRRNSFDITSAIFLNAEFWNKYYGDFVRHAPSFYPFVNHKTLTEIANINCSDKGDKYLCAHHYTVEYEKIIHRLVNVQQIQMLNILEIGLNRDNTKSIPSLMMWRQYIPDCFITGFDIQSEFSSFNNKFDNIQIIIGDQSKQDDLGKLKSRRYHLIIDDGYHASKHQQITFKTMWENLEPGGFFVIEDLHWQPVEELGMKTREFFLRWQNKDYVTSDYISTEEAQLIIPEIESITFSDSKSKNWSATQNSLVCIKKNLQRVS